MPRPREATKTLTNNARRAGWAAAGVAFGAYTGRLLGGVLLGRLGADVGQVMGAAAGGWWAWEAAGEDGRAGGAGAPGQSSAATPAPAAEGEPPVDASFGP